jgi:hypothetical protein
MRGMGVVLADIRDGDGGDTGDGDGWVGDEETN